MAILSLPPNTLNPTPHLVPRHATPLSFGCFGEKKQTPDNIDLSHGFTKDTMVTAWTPADEERFKKGKYSGLQKWCLKSIAWYQRNTRKWVDDGNGKGHIKRSVISRCPYKPSCSEYTAEAIKEYGVPQGIWKGFCRINFRCNPFYIRWKYGTWTPEERSLDDPLPPKNKLKTSA